eukprot:Nk52_evm2s545 gene=Nk52_evmTU2s545
MIYGASHNFVFAKGILFILSCCAFALVMVYLVEMYDSELTDLVWADWFCSFFLFTVAAISVFTKLDSKWQRVIPFLHIIALGFCYDEVKGVSTYTLICADARYRRMVKKSIGPELFQPYSQINCKAVYVGLAGFALAFLIHLAFLLTCLLYREHYSGSSQGLLGGADKSESGSSGGGETAKKHCNSFKRVAVRPDIRPSSLDNKGHRSNISAGSSSTLSSFRKDNNTLALVDQRGGSSNVV